MRTRSVSWLAAVTMIALSCSGSSDENTNDTSTPTAPTSSEPGATEATDHPPVDTAANDEPTPVTTDEPALTPEVEMAAMLDRAPATVEFTADSAGAVSAQIGPGGGVLEASESDGTSYILTIPPGALLTSEAITMVPITTAAGDALGGSELVGVQLGPSGLLFLQPATIEISGPSVPAQPVGFAADADGAGFHIVPIVAGDQSFTILATHFSNFGAGGTELQDVINTYGVSGVGQVAISAVGTGNMNIGLPAILAWLTAIEAQIAAATGSSAIERAAAEIVALNALLGYVPAGSVNLNAPGGVVELLTDVVDQWLAKVRTDALRLRGLCSNALPEPGFRLLRWRTIVAGVVEQTENHGATPDLGDLDAELAKLQRECLTFVLTWSPTVTVSEAGGEVTTRVMAVSGPISLDRLTVSPDVSIAQQSLTGQPIQTVSIEASFAIPCPFEKLPGKATMGLGMLITNPTLGGLDEVGIEGMFAVLGVDEPLEISCMGQDFGFNFFSAEMEILNIPRNNSDGYSEFALEIVREDGAFARTTTNDSSTIGSTASLEQKLVVALAPST